MVSLANTAISGDFEGLEERYKNRGLPSLESASFPSAAEVESKISEFTSQKSKLVKTGQLELHVSLRCNGELKWTRVTVLENRYQTLTKEEKVLLEEKIRKLVKTLAGLQNNNQPASISAKIRIGKNPLTIKAETNPEQSAKDKIEIINPHLNPEKAAAGILKSKPTAVIIQNKEQLEEFIKAYNGAGTFKIYLPKNIINELKIRGILSGSKIKSGIEILELPSAQAVEIDEIIKYSPQVKVDPNVLDTIELPLINTLSLPQANSYNQTDLTFESKNSETLSILDCGITYVKELPTMGTDYKQTNDDEIIKRIIATVIRDEQDRIQKNEDKRDTFESLEGNLNYYLTNRHKPQYQSNEKQNPPTERRDRVVPITKGLDKNIAIALKTKPNPGAELQAASQLQKISNQNMGKRYAELLALKA